MEPHVIAFLPHRLRQRKHFPSLRTGGVLFDRNKKSPFRFSEVHDDKLVLAHLWRAFHGSEMPKSRQIFRARNLLISICLGTAERRLATELPHQE
jgi:hypothetical protein